MGWTTKAKKIAAGKWVRFDAATPQHVVTFIGEPEEVEKESQQGPTKGEKYKQRSFPVLVEGEEKKLEPNRSLLVQLIEEDEEEEIIGAEFLIKCLNPDKKTQWKLRRIAGAGSGIESYKKKAEPDQEDETEPEASAPDSEEKEKDKAKFMEGVEKKKAARKKKVILEVPAKED